MTDPGSMTMTEILRLQSRLQQELTRRFQHHRLLVFSDIVGSTAYFARFGDAAGRQLQQLHRDLLEQCLVPAEGRIVDTAGDAAFAVYPMAEAAVPSLIAFQQALAGANAARGRPHQLQVRIGMHWGPVLTDGIAVSGDAVNLCARVASSAEAGEIRLTHDVFQQLLPAHRLICRGLGPVALQGPTVELLALEWRDPAAFPRRLRIIESREERDLPQQDIISFGRLLEHEGARANDIVLAHPDPELARQISRWHFELRRAPDGLRLRTLSDNATEVDGQRLGKGIDVVVRSGSRIRVADVLTLSLMGTQRRTPDKDPESTRIARPAVPSPTLGDAPTWGPGAVVDRAAGAR